MKGPLDHARGLREKARHDLITAEAALATGEVNDMVCFHAQQAAEKDLKALIAAHGAEYPLVHDLKQLVELAEQYWQPSQEFLAALVSLSSYAVVIRYDAEAFPTAEEASAALETARRLHDAVGALIGEREGGPPERG